MFSLRLENENANIVDIDDGVNYVVLSASGLTPPSASLFLGKSPNRKGAKYNGSTLDVRNIVLQIKILGNVEANRNALYAWVDTEQYVKVYFQNGAKSVYCEGHVEDCDADMFTDNEVVSVAIVCENPYWKALQEISAEISNIAKQFTFPFAIDAGGVPFSTIKSSNDASVFNAGAETGLQIKVACSGEVTNLKIYNANNVVEYFELNTTLLENWVVVIDTDASPKTVKAYKPDGTVENLLKYTSNPKWFTLKKGNNRFGYTATSGANNATLTISFRNKYLGV